MKKILFVTAGLLAVFGIVNSVDASTVISSDITGNVTWSENSAPYIIQGNVVVTQGSRLKVLPGTVIKFTEGSKILVNGELKAEGEKNKKIFLTSINDDLIGGDSNENGSSTVASANDDWQIMFDGSKDSRMKYVEIRNSAQPFLYNSSKDFSIENSKVSNVQRFVHQQAGELEIKNSEFVNITDTTFFLFNNSKLKVSNSDFSAINFFALVFDSSRLSLERVNIDNAVSGVINAYANSNVNIEDVKIKNVIAGSAIQLYGSSDLELEKSSIQDVADTALQVFEESDYKLKNTILSGGSTGIKLFGALKSSGDIDHVTIQNFTVAGIQSFDGGKIKIHDGTIINNKVGVMSFRENKFDISNNTIAFNTEAGIQNFGTGLVKAERVYWGNSSGPFHAVLNPNGTGNQVSDNVDFIPWAREQDRDWEDSKDWHKDDHGHWERHDSKNDRDHRDR